MKISTFESKCSCGHKFDLPVLSDMSYGEYLYFDIDGSGPRYFCGLNNVTWNFVSKLIDQKIVNDSGKGIIIQKIIGKIADKLNSDTEYVQKEVCPICKLFVNRINTDTRTGLIDVKELSFEQFENQNEHEKRRIISELLKPIVNL